MGILLKYLFGVLKSVVAVLAGVFVVPVALLQAGRERLPKWAHPWDNDREPFGDTSRSPAIYSATGLKHLWLRYVWLGFRNPANNYAREVSVLPVTFVVIERRGNQLTSDQNQPGWKLNKLIQCGKRVVAFEFYLVWAYTATRCLRVRLGWKLDDPLRPLVHVINPFMPFTGKRP